MKYLVLMLMSAVVCDVVRGGAVQLHSGNVDEVLNGHEFVMVNFYADWCRFSQILSPLFDEAANKVKEEFPTEGQVVLAKVDCDRESGIAARFGVSKYPTLKLFRYGNMLKREYRGQRSVDAIGDYMRGQLRSLIQVVDNLDDLDNVDRRKRHIIAYLDMETSPDYAAFKKVASLVRDDCTFHAAFGTITEPERIAGNKIVYRPPLEHSSDMIFGGSPSDYELLYKWVVDKCIPLVRQITFENAEELTEEGLPFMILFHHPDDVTTPEKFSRQVAIELLNEASRINFLVADGLQFAHPLHHLGKSSNDLPVLAIDSIRHMYLWPHNPATDIDKQGLLKAFITDLVEHHMVDVRFHLLDRQNGTNCLLIFG